MTLFAGRRRKAGIHPQVKKFLQKMIDRLPDLI
jgi:hypothetical protein